MESTKFLRPSVCSLMNSDKSSKRDVIKFLLSGIYPDGKNILDTYSYSNCTLNVATSLPELQGVSICTLF